MRSRWYHKPVLHSSAHGEKRATWLELFFDLIFVASFIQLGNGLADHVSVEGVLVFGGVFFPIWMTWTGFTFYANRYTVDDFAHRNLVLLQMFAVGAMAISAPMVLEGETRAFSVAAGVGQLIVSVMYLRSLVQLPEGRAYAIYWGGVFGVAGTLWLLAALLPSNVAIGVWIIATLVILASPFSKQSLQLNALYPSDAEHLGERFGLLTLIVLGESFVKILGLLVSEGDGLALYMDAGVLLLITCGVWWVYFDDVAGSHVRSGRAGLSIWLYSHIPLQLGIIAVAVALKKAVHFNWGRTGPRRISLAP